MLGNAHIFFFGGSSGSISSGGERNLLVDMQERVHRPPHTLPANCERFVFDGIFWEREIKCA